MAGIGFLRLFRERSTAGRNSLRGSVTRPGNSQLADAVPEGIGVHFENLSRAFWAADFPSGLLQHLKNMSPLDLFKRRSIYGWAFLPRRLNGGVHPPPANVNNTGDRIEVGYLGRKQVEPQG